MYGWQVVIGRDRFDKLGWTVCGKNRAIAVLYDTDVPVSRALTTARTLRADGQRVTTIWRSGKFGYNAPA